MATPREPAISERQQQDASLTIRRAQPVDVPVLTQMLVRAYMDDPVAIWMCSSEGLRARTLAAMYSTRLRRMLVHHGVWTNAQLSSVAVWLAPGCHKPGMRPNAALLGCLLDPRVLVRAPRLAAGLHSMERAHPHGPPHWYLSLLGTDPRTQGQGLGSAVLQPVLERCDVDGAGAYLESSKRRNLDFYSRFGFQVIGELKLPAGPTMWLMWREPREA